MGLKWNSKGRYFLVGIVNYIVIHWIVWFAWTGSDKSVFVSACAYLMLILLNAVLWVIASLRNKKYSAIYKFSTITLLLFLIPILFILTLY